MCAVSVAVGQSGRLRCWSPCSRQGVRGGPRAEGASGRCAQGSREFGDWREPGECGESAAKKPKWDDFKKKKKELKQSRQLSDKTNYDIVVRAKQIWELLRRKDCDKEKRVKLMSDLQKLIQGKIKTIAFAHDSTRVIQCFIRYGNEEQRKQAFEELREVNQRLQRLSEVLKAM